MKNLMLFYINLMDVLRMESNKEWRKYCQKAKISCEETLAIIRELEEKFSIQFKKSEEEIFQYYLQIEKILNGESDGGYLS